MKLHYKSPISIKLLEKDKYELCLELDGWKISKLITEKAISELKKQIEDVSGISKITDNFNCTGEDSEKIKKFWDERRNWKLCNSCNFKWKECHNCIIKCDSPLERDLLLELKRQGVNTILQRRINKDGSHYDFPEELNFDTLLTVPDFYIEIENVKICVYADGHTYHERTEKQALRDKNIDRELQKLGFIVLRYTGKEIRSDVNQVVKNIKSHFDG